MLMAMLRAAASADPTKPAIVCGGARISYGELAARVTRCAAGLRGLGIEPGSCVAAALVNGPEFIIAFLATASLRAIFLPLNPRYTRGELQRFIADGEARAVIAGGPSLAACRGSTTDRGSGTGKRPSAKPNRAS